MAFDYKKEYKEFYLPPRKPGIVTVPPINFVSVQGRGDPNEPGGEYQAAMELLYGIAFTIKMSYKGSHKIDVTLNMLSHRWRVCGIRRGWKAWTTPTKNALSGQV